MIGWVTEINIVLVVIIVMALLALFYLIGKKEIPTAAAAIVLLLFTALAIGIMTDETESGTPKEFGDIPKNTPLVVKTVDWEDPESLIYLTVVSYNNVNGTRTFYKISWDDVETPINLSVGTRIINDGGIIKQV